MKKIITALIILFVFQTLHSQTWVRKLDGISMWSLGKDFSGKVYAGASGTVKSIFKSSNGGTSWDTVLSGGASNFLSIACDSLGGVYAANVSNGLMKSSNGGLNWTNIPVSVFGGASVQSVACGRNGYVYVGVTNGGVYGSTDYGATFPVNGVTGLTVVTLAVDRFNPNIIYAGASSASPPNYGFYKSTDAGMTFSANLLAYNIWGVAEKSNSHLYTVTTSSGYPFHKSSNGGLNWTMQCALTGAMRGMCIDLSENIYTAGNGGVFKSTNDGASFVNFNYTFSSNQIISFQNKILVAASGTTSGGVYVYTDTLVGIGQPSSIPDKFVLNQNWPNPFNPGTVIPYTLSESGSVRLSVYDAAGRLIAVLVNQKQSEGKYEITFSGPGLASGVYFYQLTCEGFTQSRKMILLK